MFVQIGLPCSHTFEHWRWFQLHFFGEIWSPSSLHKFFIFLFFLVHHFLFIINLYLIVSIFCDKLISFEHSIVLVLSSSRSTCNGIFSRRFFISTTEIDLFQSTPSTQQKPCSFGKMLQKLNGLFCYHP